MALRLDNNLLDELGLGSLPPAEKDKMKHHIYETLEMRVGVRLAEQMSDQQLDEFESYINANDEAGALRWLETTFPSYKEVVADEFEKLKNEIKQVAPQIVTEAISSAQQEGSQQAGSTNGTQEAQQPPAQQPSQYPPQQPPAGPPANPPTTPQY